MRMVLITFITPASENIRGTSALPYHLIKGIKEASVNKSFNSQDITIYTYNSNKLSREKIAAVEKELDVIIKNIPLPKWYIWMFKFHLLFLRLFLKYPFVNYIKLPQMYVEEIKSQKPDLIWIYQEELSRIVKQFPNHRRIQIGPDVESLYYYRMLGQRFVMKDTLNYWKCALMYRKYARMERKFCTDNNYTYFAVGEEDVHHLRNIYPHVNAKFLRHPHYEVSKLKVENGKLKIKFHQPKIKLLIAGQHNHYMKQEADSLIEQMKENANVNDNFLINHYELTFLGKGWETHVETLRKAGYEVNHIKFAPDYIEEICKHDIQITPIAIGTGTKGKVLDALANGLLVIGTKYAIENIALKNGESCIEYSDAKEVVDILRDIPINLKRYEEIAENGCRCVLGYHNREKIARELFG